MKNFLNNLLIIVFFTHGIIYFVFPDEIYNIDSPLKLIKYFICFVIILLNVKKLTNIPPFILIVFLQFFLIFISHDFTLISTTEFLNRILVYLMPLTTVLISNGIAISSIKKTTIFIVLISVLSTFLEYFFFRGLFVRYDFSESGGFIRSASIYVNPNNAALVFTLFIIFINERFRNFSYIKFVLIILLILCIILTGSKTPLFLLSLYAFVIFLSWLRKYETIGKYIPIMFLLLLILLIVILFFLSNQGIFSLNFFNSREFSLETGTIRIEQFNSFIDLVNLGNPYFPNYNNFQQTYDLSILQIWSDFSLFGVFFFYGFCLYKLYSFFRRRDRLKFSILFVILISSFSLQVFYIWPIAYIFWFIILKDKKTVYNKEAL